MHDVWWAVLALAVLALGVWGWFSFVFGFGSWYVRVLRDPQRVPMPDPRARGADDNTFVVSATQLGVRSWWGAPRLLRLGAPIVLQQLQRDGCVAWAWYACPSLRLFWLYSVWPSRAALRRFAHADTSRGHGRVAERGGDYFPVSEYPNFAVRTWDIPTKRALEYPDWQAIQSRFGVFDDGAAGGAALVRGSIDEDPHAAPRSGVPATPAH